MRVAAEGNGEPSLDQREQLARIAKLEAEVDKLVRETKLAVPQAIFQGTLAAAALIGAVVAAFKLFV